MKEGVAAIIVAAGQGLRFGGRVRKQYLRLRGRPLVWWSLKAFDRSPSIAAIILVVPPDDRATVTERVRAWKLTKRWEVVAGGATRAKSVWNGLWSLPRDFRWVAVHDGVRPLVTPHMIEKTIREARRHGGAIVAWPSKDTVKLVTAKGYVQTTPPRETVWLAQTPQIFRRDLLERAYARADHFQATDEAQMVESLGVPVKLVEGSANNLKVTVPSDLAMARAILKGK